jgi:hypothetical protein
MTWLLCMQGRQRVDSLQSLVALTTPHFAEQLCPRNADGSLPPQTPELLAGLMDPVQDALQQVLAPVLRRMPEGSQQLPEPVFKQVGAGSCGSWAFDTTACVLLVT